MKRRALHRRYGRAKYGLPAPGEYPNMADPRHAYVALIRTIRANPGETKFMLRHWLAQWGLHKAITDKALSLAERRGHVVVDGGRYYSTGRGVVVSSRLRFGGGP
jgi:hypothetical protein